jgi:hypothetical protein
VGADLTPVIFPPGRAKLVASPASIASPPIQTIGIEPLAARTARATASPRATVTSGLLLPTSRVRSAKSSGLPSPEYEASGCPRCARKKLTAFGIDVESEEGCSRAPHPIDGAAGSRATPAERSCSRDFLCVLQLAAEGFGARLNAVHKIVRRASSRQTWLALDPLPSGEFTLL